MICFSPQQRARLIARMARTLTAYRDQYGICTKFDLLCEGFSKREIDSVSEDARVTAARGTYSPPLDDHA